MTTSSQTVEADVIYWIHKRAHVSRIMVEFLEERGKTLEEMTEQRRTRALDGLVPCALEESPDFFLAFENVPHSITDHLLYMPLPAVDFILA